MLWFFHNFNVSQASIENADLLEICIFILKKSINEYYLYITNCCKCRLNPFFKKKKKKKKIIIIINDVLCHFVSAVIF